MVHRHPKAEHDRRDDPTAAGAGLEEARQARTGERSQPDQSGGPQQSREGQPAEERPERQPQDPGGDVHGHAHAGQEARREDERSATLAEGAFAAQEGGLGDHPAQRPAAQSGATEAAADEVETEVAHDNAQETSGGGGKEVDHPARDENPGGDTGEVLAGLHGGGEKQHDDQQAHASEERARAPGLGGAAHAVRRGVCAHGQQGGIGGIGREAGVEIERRGGRQMHEARLRQAAMEFDGGVGEGFAHGAARDDEHGALEQGEVSCGVIKVRLQEYAGLVEVMPGNGAEVWQQRTGGTNAEGGEGVHGAVERGVAEQVQFGEAVGLVENEGADEIRAGDGEVQRGGRGEAAGGDHPAALRAGGEQVGERGGLTRFTPVEPAGVLGLRVVDWKREMEEAGIGRRRGRGEQDGGRRGLRLRCGRGVGAEGLPEVAGGQRGEVEQQPRGASAPPGAGVGRGTHPTRGMRTVWTGAGRQGASAW